MIDPESLSGQMLDRLTGSGELSPTWFEAFAAVLRHRFFPDTIWVTDGAGWCRCVAVKTRRSGCDAPMVPLR